MNTAIQACEHLQQLALNQALKPEYVQSLKLSSQIMRIIGHCQENGIGSDDLVSAIENHFCKHYAGV